MKNKIIIACVITAVVVGGAAFYGGMKYQQGQVASKGGFMMQGGNFSGQRQGAGNVGVGSRNANGVGMASGEIIAKDDKSLTVKMSNGSSKIILYAASTEWQKMTSATAGDFAVGQQVVASGTSNIDGSLTAKQVQLRSDVQPSKN